MGWFVPNVEVTLKNCQPGTWVGIVKLIKDGDRVVDFEYIPHMRLKKVGSLTSQLEPGYYGITYYRPKGIKVDADGNKIFQPAKILMFFDTHIIEPVRYEFGCSGRNEVTIIRKK
jgi:hypothetical protein